jgi:drug/metabolite transporter (DMT)-like permease
MAVLFALVAAMGWGSSDYAAGHASRKSSAVSVVILTHLASVIALVVIATMPGQTGSPQVSDLLWGLAAGLGGGFGAMLLFSGLGKGSMSVVAPITAVGAAMIPVVAGVLQGESLGGLGLIGIVLALGAIVMVSLSDDAAAGGDDDGVGEGIDERSDARGSGGSPTHVDTSRAHEDALIAAYEREFATALPVPAPTGARRGVAGSWSAPAGSVASLAPPSIAQARSFNELAAAVHLQRDTFELARLNQTRPVISAPMPDVFSRTTSSKRAKRPAGRSASRNSAPGTPRRSLGAVVRSMLGRPGVVEALLSGIGFGLFFVFIARTSESAGHWPLVGARFISVVMFAAGAIIATSAVMPDRTSRPAVILAGLLDAAAAVFFVLSTRSGLLSVGAVLASLYPAVTVLLARFVGKERVTRQQAIGLVLAGLAVSMLAL